MKFSDKIKKFFTGLTASSNISDELLEDFCDLLIEGDFGAAEAYKITDLLKEKCKKNAEEPILVLAELLNEELAKAKLAKYPLPAKFPLSATESKLTAVLILGVNGVGKTTSAAKLANLYANKFNKKSILAAADTFRAAAIDQLKIHGEKLNTRVIAHKHGGDPAAVVYDALEAAMSSGSDLVITDTAGRMHTKSALVEELRKIDRVVESKAAGVQYLKYLVLDATTGRNAYTQAEVFSEAVALDGVILTKYDSTAKGGVVFSLASGLKLPVAFICTGEKYTDIDFFDSKKFTKEFTGIE